MEVNRRASAKRLLSSTDPKPKSFKIANLYKVWFEFCMRAIEVKRDHAEISQLTFNFSFFTVVLCFYLIYFMPKQISILKVKGFRSIGVKRDHAEVNLNFHPFWFTVVLCIHLITRERNLVLISGAAECRLCGTVCNCIRPDIKFKFLGNRCRFDA